jgi:primosomal protein N'
MQFIRFERGDHSVYTVDMTKEHHRLSELAHKSIEKALRLGRRVLVLGARKWYAWGHMCTSCGNVPQCAHCDVPIAFHKIDSDASLAHHEGLIWLCHICKTQYPPLVRCQQCHSDAVEYYGYGIQQIAEFITETFGLQPSIVDNSHVNSPTKLTKTLALLADSQIVVATTLLSLPPADIVFDVVIVLQADMWLNNPNFHATWQHFTWLYTLVQDYPHTHIVLQTHLPDHPWILAAASQNVELMRTYELEKRLHHHYPPYGEFCILLYKHEIEERLFGSVHKLYQELLYLKESLQVEVSIYATPPLVYKMFGKYRYTIILTWPSIRSFVERAYTQLRIRSRWFKVDRDPRQIV